MTFSAEELRALSADELGAIFPDGLAGGPSRAGLAMLERRQALRLVRAR